MSSWIQFVILVGLLTMLPGIDTAQVLRSSIKGGPRLAYLTLVGIMFGTWVWGVAAAVGISAVLLASAELYTVVRYIGAAYLVYLGLRMIIEARKAGGLVLGKTPALDSPMKAMARAFTVTLTNPKNGAFYVAVLPQFIPVDMNPVVAGLALSSIHNVLAVIWFTGVIFLTNLAKNFFARPRVGKAMEYVSGTALMGFGAKLALEKL